MFFKNLFFNLIKFVLIASGFLILVNKFPIRFMPSEYWVQTYYFPTQILCILIALVGSYFAFRFLIMSKPDEIDPSAYGPHLPYVIDGIGREQPIYHLFIALIAGPLLALAFYFIPMRIVPSILSLFTLEETVMAVTVKSTKNSKGCWRGVQFEHLKIQRLCDVSKETYKEVWRGKKLHLKGYGGKFGIFFSEFEIMPRD